MMDENFMRQLKNAVDALEDFNSPSSSKDAEVNNHQDARVDRKLAAKALSELIKEQITDEISLSPTSKTR